MIRGVWYFVFVYLEISKFWLLDDGYYIGSYLVCGNFLSRFWNFCDRFLDVDFFENICVCLGMSVLVCVFFILVWSFLLWLLIFLDIEIRIGWLCFEFFVGFCFFGLWVVVFSSLRFLSVVVCWVEVILNIDF